MGHSFFVYNSLQKPLQHHLVLPSVGRPEPIAFQTALRVATRSKEGPTRLVICTDVAPQLLKPQHLSRIACHRLQGIRSVASSTIFGLGNKDSNPCTAIQQVNFKEIQRTNGTALGAGLDDESLLAGLLQIELLLIEKSLQLMTREGGNGATHSPHRRIVFPTIHRLNIFGLKRT